MTWTMVNVVLLLTVLYGAYDVGATSNRKLLLMIVDGLAHDGLDRMTSIADILDQGVRAEYLQPVFPAVGISNYVSLLTGLFPEEHGIVDEYLYEEQTGSFFIRGVSGNANGTDETSWLQHGEMFWTMIEKAGKRVVVYDWPMCNSSSVVGANPIDCRLSSTERTSLNSSYESLTEALDLLKSNNTDVAIMFVNELDHITRSTNLKSKQYQDTLSSIDKFIGFAASQSDDLNLSDDLNTVVVSTHGFATLTRPPLVIDVSRFSPDVKTAITFFPGGSHLAIYPKKDALIRTFNNLYRRHRHVKVYWKWNMPEKWRIRGAALVAPILVAADPGWAVVSSTKEANFLATTRGGLDGYDPDEEPRMRGTFIAFGPDLKTNYTSPAIHVTKLLNLLRRLAGLSTKLDAEFQDMMEDAKSKSGHRKLHTTTKKPENATITEDGSGDDDRGSGDQLLTAETKPEPKSSTINASIVDEKHDFGSGSGDDDLAMTTGHTEPETGSGEVDKVDSRTEIGSGQSGTDNDHEETGSGQLAVNHRVGDGDSLSNTTVTDQPEHGSGQITDGGSGHSMDIDSGHSTNDESENSTETGSGHSTAISSGQSTKDENENSTETGSGHFTNDESENSTETGNGHLTNDESENSTETGSGHSDNLNGPLGRALGLEIGSGEMLRDDVRGIEAETGPTRKQLIGTLTSVGCECTEKLCTTKEACRHTPNSNHEDFNTTDEVVLEPVNSTDLVDEHSPINLTDDEQFAQVDVHDWRQHLSRRHERSAPVAAELGSGEHPAIQAAEISITLEQKIDDQSGGDQSSSQEHKANLKTSFYDANNGFLLHNQYNAPYIDLRASKIDDTSTNKLLNAAGMNSKTSTDSQSVDILDRSTTTEPITIPPVPVRLNQFHVSNGGMALQINMDKPLINLNFPSGQGQSDSSNWLSEIFPGFTTIRREHQTRQNIKPFH